MAVEAQTSSARAAMAAKLRARSGRFSPGTAQATRSKWHEDRIKGLAERATRILECGHPTGVFEGYTASQESVTAQVRQRCGDAVLCAACRWRRREHLRRGIAVKVPEARRYARLQMSKYYKGAEGRWSERLITLTTPHSGSPALDAQIIKRAWRMWTRKVTEHLKKDRGCERLPVWLRVVEVAHEGRELHVHQHVWWLGPYLEHTLARHWWGEALREAGAPVLPPTLARAAALSKAIDARTERWLVTRRGKNGRHVEAVWWPHFYVNRAPKDVAAGYSSKMGAALYTTKGSEVEQLEPIQAAAAWHALKVVRSIAWARGWAPKRSERVWVWHSIRRHTQAEANELRAEAEKKIAARAQAPPGPQVRVTN